VIARLPSARADANRNNTAPAFKPAACRSHETDCCPPFFRCSH
jgi:hypothetical protein